MHLSGLTNFGMQDGSSPLAHERACVAKVAVDLAGQFGQNLEPWCEVSLFGLCQWKHEFPVMSRAGAVDLVLCDSSHNQIAALVEFKTNHITEDTEKLTILQRHL